MNNKNIKIKINPKKSTYNITIGQGLLSNIDKYFNLKRKILIISDDNIPKKFINAIKNKCDKPFIHIIKHGEKNKNINNYLKIEEKLIKNNFTRHDAIVAVGGGMVGDLSGFAASTYMRGIDFYNVPTTLLSQVDSSIGGKTAINFSNIKNIVGSFYQPKAVLIDIDTLNTLPIRELNSGFVESLKMALTFDKKFFDYLSKCPDIKKNAIYIIDKSLNIKKKVVENDEKESNIRRVLNFGHTIGHAIEEEKKGQLLHGECVGLGIIYFIDKKYKQKIIDIYSHYNLPTNIKYNKKNILNLISHDKKSNKNSISIIRVDKIGKYKIVDMKLDDIKSIL